MPSQPHAETLNTSPMSSRAPTHDVLLSQSSLVSSRAQSRDLLSHNTPPLSSRAQSRDLLLVNKTEAPNSVSCLRVFCVRFALSPVFSLPKRFFRLLLATLREIGDENAYHRHLTAHGLQHSGTEWRRFCDERWLAASKRAKCC